MCYSFADDFGFDMQSILPTPTPAIYYHLLDGVFII